MLQRGDVYTARLDRSEGAEQRGTGPVVLVSRTEFNQCVPIVTVVPLSSFKGERLYPSEALVRRGDGGLRRDSIALGQQVTTISRARLGRRTGSLQPETLERISRALAFHIGVPDAEPSGTLE